MTCLELTSFGTSLFLGPQKQYVRERRRVSPTPRGQRDEKGSDWHNDRSLQIKDDLFVAAGRLLADQNWPPLHAQFKIGSFASMAVAPLNSSLPLLAITGSQRPYIYDLPHVLSLPEGFEFRFRYRHMWVENRLAAEVRAESPDLQGKELILLFHSQETCRLIPIRKCTIVSIENIGPMVFIRFRVGPFPHVDIDALMNPDWKVADAAADRLSNLGRDLLGDAGAGPFDLSKALPQQFYLRYANALPSGLTWAPELTAPDIGAAWARLVVCLLKEPNLVEIPMFHILGFQREDGKFEKALDVKQFDTSHGPIRGFRLVEGSRYRLRVLEWCEPPPGASPKSLKIKPEFRGEVLELEGASDLVVGRYDVIELTFRAARPGYTELAIRAEPVSAPKQDHASGSPITWFHKVISKSEKTLDWPAIFSARVPVRVRNKTRRVVAAAAISVLGVLIYGVGPAYSVEYADLLKGIGLLMTFPILGEYLERFVKYNESMRKFIKME